MHALFACMHEGQIMKLNEKEKRELERYSEEDRRLLEELLNSELR